MSQPVVLRAWLNADRAGEDAEVLAVELRVRSEHFTQLLIKFLWLGVAALIVAVRTSEIRVHSAGIVVAQALDEV